MKKGLVINESVWPMIDDLEPDEKAALFSALSAYYRGNPIPETARIVRMVFNAIAADNARFDPEHRGSLSETRSEAGRKGAESRWQTVAKMANDGKDSKTWQTMANDGKNGNLPQDKKREEEKRVEEKRVEKKAILPEELNQDYVIEAFKSFKEMRDRMKKPLTQRGAELIIVDLMKHSAGDPVVAAKILEQSVKNGWQGVFPLKDNRPKGRIDWDAI